MKLVVLSPSSLPEELLAGLGHLCESEGFAVGEGGIAVTARRAGRFAFRLEENSLEVEYRVPAEFFRALPYLKQPSRQPLAWKQQPAFAEVGAMLDCSRNAVLTPDTVKLMLRKMALMGMSVAMLYHRGHLRNPSAALFWLSAGPLHPAAAAGTGPVCGGPGHRAHPLHPDPGASGAGAALAAE